MSDQQNHNTYKTIENHQHGITKQNRPLSSKHVYEKLTFNITNPTSPSVQLGNEAACSWRVDPLANCHRHGPRSVPGHGVAFIACLSAFGRKMGWSNSTQDWQNGIQISIWGVLGRPFCHRRRHQRECHHRASVGNLIL